MPGLEDLYREIILDHYRSPRNRGELAVPPATKAEGFNPLCGDEVVLYLDIDPDTETVRDAVVSWDRPEWNRFAEAAGGAAVSEEGDGLPPFRPGWNSRNA